MNATIMAIEIVGWVGAAIILASYILLSLGRLEARGYPYQIMNVVGATGFIINSGYYGAIPSAALNTVWAAMGLFTLAMIWRTRQKTSHQQSL